MRAIVQVSIRNNDLEQGLRVLKKKLQREGVFREMKKRKHYEKPSEVKARRMNEAVRRQRKLRSLYVRTFGPHMAAAQDDQLPW